MVRKKLYQHYKLFRKKRIIIGYFLFEYLTNKLLKKGKKNLAKHFIKILIKNLKKRSNLPIFFIIEKAIHNIRPSIKIISKLKSLDKKKNNNKVLKLSFNKKSQTIVELNILESTKIAINWLIKGAQMRDSTNISLSLTLEILEAFKKKGNAIKQRFELYEKAKFLSSNKKI